MPAHRRIPALIVWAYLIVACVPRASVAASPGGSRFAVTPLESGLPSSSVIAVTQARDGYLWVGTLDGLARFDGIRFTVFDATELPGLSTGPVVFLFGDSRENLWVGTDSAGSKLIKDGRVRPLDIGTRSREGRLVGAAEDGNGDVWLATANGQLARHRAGRIDVWWPLPGGCRGLALETNGALWLASSQELILLDTGAVVSGKDLPEVRHFPVGQVDFVLASRHGGFWLMANGKVLHIRDRQSERDFGFYPWATAPILSACEDDDGNLIVGTRDRGLTRFDADGRAETVTSANGLSHNTVLALAVDREGSLWVGTDGGGLNRVRRQVFQVLPAAAGITIQSVCEDDVGALWLAIAADSAARVKDGVMERFGPREGLLGLNPEQKPNSSVVLTDRQHRVWVGTRDLGLFEGANGRFRMLEDARLSGPGVNVSVIFEDRSSALWVGTQTGLGRRRENGWDFFTTTNGLADNAVTAIADDANGNVWVGTARGLNRWRAGNWLSVSGTESLPDGPVSALLVDSLGALWVGLPGRGLARLAENKWQQLGKHEGLAVTSIKYLAEDALGALWIGSATGLIRIEKSDLDGFVAGKQKTVSCRTFDRADGLPRSECSGGSQPAAWRGRGGTMWFATTRGLVFVNPALIPRNTNPPPVLIESVLVDDVLQNTNQLRPNWPEEISLSPRQERLEIRYTSLNLAAPERARFKYQLADHESGWTDAGDDRSARYPKLPPGNYRFRVIACNEDGVWNEEGATLTILVQPPFWRTWWFLTFSAVALLGLIVGTVHFISTQKLQRQLAQLKQQEALERERARIARDLHDQLGANLTQVSLLGEMVEADKDQPAEVEVHARQISETARVTAHALDEIVWAANPANDTLEGLVTYACKYAQDYLTLAGVSYRLEAPESLPAAPLPPDVRHNVFLAFKEAVNNVVKHAQATAVRVRLALGANHFSFEIEDNGRGLSEADRTKGRNGLRNMARRMKDVGGEFDAGPAAERGTRVRLTAPLPGH